MKKEDYEIVIRGLGLDVRGNEHGLNVNERRMNHRASERKEVISPDSLLRNAPQPSISAQL